MVLLGYGLAIVIGISLGLLGGGGSILTVPVLVYVMHLDVKQAVPTSLVVVGLTTLVGTFHHARAGNVAVRTVVAFAPAAILGSFGGTRIALLVSGRVQLTIFAVVLLVAAVRMLRGGVVGHGPGSGPRSPMLMALLGAGVGCLTGLVGVGGGFMYVPALVLVGGLDMKRAVGTSLVLITLSSAAGVVGYLGKASFDLRFITIFTGLAFVGVAAGSALVHRVSQEGLRRGFGVLMLLMGVLVLIRR